MLVLMGNCVAKGPVGVYCIQAILPLENRQSWLFLVPELWNVGDDVEYVWSGFQHALQC